MIEEILVQVQKGKLTVEEAKAQLANYENLGFVKIDHHRKKRVGFAEVVYGEGKTPEQILAIVQSLRKRNDSVLVTRISKDKADYVRAEFPEFDYHTAARILAWKNPSAATDDQAGYIAVVCAGTSDLPVAEEAAISAEILGCRVVRVYDVGVAGLHRLLDNIETIRNAVVTIVVAGMEGALPSVVGGLITNPIIAVPTSVGYGANLNGISALLTMLNSCASGITVVNIDNGFGAAYSAALIHNLATKGVNQD